VPEEWGVFTTLFNADESTFTFLEDVLKETMDLFPGQYIHVGGDEAAKDEWKASPAIQARMKQLGVKDEQELQSYFIHRMEKVINANGRKLIGWDEILEGGLAPNATVMSWRGIEGAITAANAGHDTVLSPAPQLYLDHWQYDGDPAPGRSNTLSLEDVYKFDPTPGSIAPEQRKHILGLQANLWAEFMRSPERVEYQAYPRVAALAEVAWSDPSNIDWAGFQQRMPAQLKRYDLLGIRYAKPLPAKTLAANRRTSHELDSCTDGYLLSLEDDAPLVGQRAVFLVNISNPCWIFRGADLSNIVGISANVGQIPFNFQIGKDASGIPLVKPRGFGGELEVRLDNCDGKLLASISLEYAMSSAGVSRLPLGRFDPQTGTHDLCLRFTRRSIDPIWTIDSLELVGN
jgi:hexosaminidase